MRYRLYGQSYSESQLKTILTEIIARYAEEQQDDGEHWITVGGQRVGRNKHVGGTPVKINAAGTITKGPDELKGHSLAEITKDQPKAADEKGKPPIPGLGQPTIPELYVLTDEQVNAQENSPVWQSLKSQVLKLPPNALSKEAKTYLNYVTRAYFAGKLDDDGLRAAFGPYVGNGINIETALQAKNAPPAAPAAEAPSTPAPPPPPYKPKPELEPVVESLLRLDDNYYGLKNDIKNFGTTGNAAPLFQAIHGSMQSKPDFIEKANKILKRAGYEPPPIAGEGGQFALPGIAPGSLSQVDDDGDSKRVALPWNAASKLTDFIAMHSPESTFSGSEYSANIDDKFKTPSGEEFQLYNTDEERNFPHVDQSDYGSITDKGAVPIDPDLLESIPRKMGWDTLTTAAWNQLVDKEVDGTPWSDLVDAEQSARDTYHEEQAAENENSDDDDDDVYHHNGYYDEASVDHNSPSASTTGKYYGVPQDFVDQSAMKDVLSQSRNKLDSYFSNGAGDNDVADTFWDYVRGNRGSLNRGLIPGSKYKRDDQLYDACDEMIDAVGTWKKPMTVFRACYASTTSREKFLKRVQWAIDHHTSFWEPGFGHTSVSAAKALDSFHSLGGVLLVIKSKTGAWIAPYTQYSGENEILKKRRTRYYPKRVYVKDLSGHPGTTIVECEEMTPEEIVAERNRRNAERQAEKSTPKKKKAAPKKKAAAKKAAPKKKKTP